MISRSPSTMYEVCGVISNVDIPARQLTVVVDNAAMIFDVALDCTITLHDDRVKLRLLQPMDYARVLCSDSSEARVAHAIRVNWWLSEAPVVCPAKAFREAAARNPVRSVG